MIKGARTASVVAVLLLGGGVVMADPANVINDAGCTTGWLGCPVADAIPLPEGGYDCPSGSLSFVGITGSATAVDPDDVHGFQFFTCTADIEFGQPNPTGPDGNGGDAIFVQPSVWCLVFPDTCQGKGAVLINARTLPALFVCGISGNFTTFGQAEVTPDGRAHLACYFPDPPQGE